MIVWSVMQLQAEFYQKDFFEGKSKLEFYSVLDEWRCSNNTIHFLSESEKILRNSINYVRGNVRKTV